MNKYRNTKSKGEILNTFCVSIPGKSTLWQKNDEKRRVYEVDDIIVNTTIRTAKIILKDEDAHIDPSQTIYLKLSKNDSIMKLRCLNKSYNEISIILPDEIQAVEYRTFPRTRFKPTDTKLGTIVLSSEITQTSTQALKFNILDLSESGLSVMVSDKNKELLIRSNSYYLTHLGDVELPNPVPLDFIYLKNHMVKNKGRTHRSNRAGFRMAHFIDKEFITIFSLS